MPTNSNTFNITVVWGNGPNEGKEAVIDVKPRELFWSDVPETKGLVTTFAMRYNDGSVGNFVLLPNNKFVDVSATIAAKILAPLGLSLIGDRMFDEAGRVVATLAGLGSDYFLLPFIQNGIEQWRISQCSYFAIDNGERVFRDPIWVTVR